MHSLVWKFHLHASTNNQWLHSRLFKILYIRSSFADITITFISIKFAVLWSDWFLRYFGKSNGAMSFSFFICLFKSKHNVQHNLFFAFKIKNCCYLCRFYHKRAFELIDWVIWLVNQFWLFHLNKHQLVKYYLQLVIIIIIYNVTTLNMFKNVPRVQSKMRQ